MKNEIFSRSTRECYFDQLNPDLAKAFKDRFLQDEFPGIESKIITCFETESMRKKLFSTRTEYSGVILTPDVLVWGMSGIKRNPFAAMAQIKEISEIRDYEKTESCKIMQDTGLELFGFIYLFSKRSTWFIGLGADQSGERCRHLLRELHNKVNKP